MTALRIDRSVMALVMGVGVLLGGCSKMSETVRDEAAGLNGSFEVTQAGLPVNWLLYTPATVPTGDYELIVDTAEYKVGKQSLKFLVRACAPTGGWHSPGLAQEVEAAPGQTYKASFWVRNEGAAFRVRLGGVKPFEGQMETVVASGDTIEPWQYFEYEYTMPQGFDRLRFELNILQPGAFWIDGIEIEEIVAGGPARSVGR